MMHWCSEVPKQCQVIKRGKVSQKQCKYLIDKPLPQSCIQHWDLTNPEKVPQNPPCGHQFSSLTNNRQSHDGCCITSEESYSK